MGQRSPIMRILLFFLGIFFSARWGIHQPPTPMLHYLYFIWDNGVSDATRLWRHRMRRRTNEGSFTL